jgi:cytochrome b
MPKRARIDRGFSAPMDARQPPGLARIWDPFVRLCHWSLVLSFAVAWLTSHSSEAIHHWAGYGAAGLVAMRLLWGAIGTPYARFAQFVRGPAAVTRYLRAMFAGREARHVGHNPAGGAMVLALMAAMIATALSGWMMTSDTYFGVDWVENIHSLSAHGMLLLVVIHICGVVLASVRHRENLVKAMITGHKRKPEPGDVA